MKWEPIATAPKDGSWFLAFYPKIEAHCFQDQWKVAHWVKDWFHEGYPGVMDAAEHEEFNQPTYWMPLPPEPWRQSEEPKQSEGDEVEPASTSVSLTPITLHARAKSFMDTHAFSTEEECIKGLVKEFEELLGGSNDR